MAEPIGINDGDALLLVEFVGTVTDEIIDRVAGFEEAMSTAGVDRRMVSLFPGRFRTYLLPEAELPGLQPSIEELLRGVRGLRTRTLVQRRLPFGVGG